MKGYRSMIGHQNRPLAIGLTAAGALFAIAEMIHPFTLLDGRTTRQHIGLGLCVMVYGMFLAAITKEKVEDERVKQVRAQAMQFIVMLVVITQLTAVSSNMVFSGSSNFISNKGILLYLIIYMTIYHVYFRIGIYSDQYWNYKTDEISLKDVYFKNKWMTAIGALIMLASILYLLFAIK